MGKINIMQALYALKINVFYRKKECRDNVMIFVLVDHWFLTEIVLKQADLQEVRLVSAVVTQGRGGGPYALQCVTSYTVEYSIDGVTFKTIDSDGIAMVSV